MGNKISVIVPVYKVEDYLPQCMASIMNQSFGNLEIILVDDGSPDCCPQMCDDYSQMDKRIRVIHKKNGGLSDARNTGLDAATGDYIFFIDSDDTMEENTLEHLLGILQSMDADIAVTTIFSPENTGIMLWGESLPMLVELATHIGTWSAWGKLYKKEIFRSIRFPKGMLYEDFYIISEVAMQANRMVISDNGMYHYTIRPDSIMGRTKYYLSEDIIEGAVHNMHVIDGIDPVLYKKLSAEFLIQPMKNICFHKFHWNISRDYRRKMCRLWKEYQKEIYENPYIHIISKKKILFFIRLAGIFNL